MEKQRYDFAGIAPAWTLDFGSAVVHVWDDVKYTNGRPCVPVRLTWKGQTVFEHCDISPAPGNYWGHEGFFAEILFWLSITEDSGADCLNDYTLLQLEWSRSIECAEMQLAAQTHEECGTVPEIEAAIARYEADNM